MATNKENENMSKKNSGKTLDLADRTAVEHIAEAINTAVDVSLESKREQDIALEETSIRERQAQLKQVALDTKNALAAMKALALEASKLRSQQKLARNIYDKTRLENLQLRVRISQGMERIAALKSAKG